MTSKIQPLAQFVDTVRRLQLLEPKQLDAVVGRFADAKSIAKELIARDWLTAYQANQLLSGKGEDLALGSYILLNRLGEGGMGAVYKARHRTLGRIVALKLIREDRLVEPNVVQRFHREVMAAAQLSHPNVVHALDADEVHGTHMLVMEYVEGVDFAKLVQNGGPLDVADACEYVRQAALGLQHAHERDLVHRDVKPHNLLLMRSETGHVVKLLDLGLARWKASMSGDQTTALTCDNVVMGTPDYMAPEQAISPHSVDIRGDLYSLGCTLHFLLIGEPPFPGGTFAEKLLCHQTRIPTPVNHLRADVPAPVADVVRKLTAKKPDQRFSSPAILADRLENVLCETRIWHSASSLPLTGICRTTLETSIQADEQTKGFWADVVSDETSVSQFPRTCIRKRRAPMLAAAIGVALLTAAATAGAFVVANQNANRTSAETDYQASRMTPFRAPAVLQLLPIIEPSADAVAGKWAFDKNNCLTSYSSKYSRIQIPYQPPAEYDLHVKFQRTTGNDCIAFLLADEYGPFQFLVGDAGNTVAAFIGLNGNGTEENQTKVVRSNWLDKGTVHDVRIEVRREAVRAFFDGKLCAHCPRGVGDVRTKGSWALRDGRILGLGAHNSTVAFHRVEIVEISGVGSYARTDASSSKGRMCGKPAPKKVESVKKMVQ